jgi:hypothetical protein
MVGGFDFVNGKGGWQSGHIFIDTNGDAKFGDALKNELSSGSNGIKIVPNSFNYDYVIDLDFGTYTYDVYKLDPGSTLSVYYNIFRGSNPWRYYSGGDPLTGYQDLNFTYYDFGTSEVNALGFSGTDHNAVSVDISFLGASVDFTSHFTIECGNDNLMGQGTTAAPEPGTLLLLGSGLAGLAWRGRRKKKSGN